MLANAFGATPVCAAQFSPMHTRTFMHAWPWKPVSMSVYVCCSLSSGAWIGLDRSAEHPSEKVLGHDNHRLVAAAFRAGCPRTNVMAHGGRPIVVAGGGGRARRAAAEEERARTPRKCPSGPTSPLRASLAGRNRQN
jgi:hypothetical protein